MPGRTAAAILLSADQRRQLERLARPFDAAAAPWQAFPMDLHGKATRGITHTKGVTISADLISSPAPGCLAAGARGGQSQPPPV